jgi:hypothetical protein
VSRVKGIFLAWLGIVVLSSAVNAETATPPTTNEPAPMRDRSQRHKPKKLKQTKKEKPAETVVEPAAPTPTPNAK